jgi:osmotically-inducible protein OsmY
LTLAAVLATMGLTGCTKEGQEKYGEAGDAASTAVKKTGDAAATDAAVTGEKAKEAGKEATKAVDNSGVTLKVKNALLTASDLKTSDLNVDTVDNTVHLKGSVQTEDQKKRAEEIAKGLVGDKMTVSNELTVVPGK